MGRTYLQGLELLSELMGKWRIVHENLFQSAVNLQLRRNEWGQITPKKNTKKVLQPLLQQTISLQRIIGKD